MQGISIVQVEINPLIFLCLKYLFHLFSRIGPRTTEICERQLIGLLLYIVADPIVNENEFVAWGTVKNICWFYVSMKNRELMHLFQIYFQSLKLFLCYSDIMMTLTILNKKMSIIICNKNVKVKIFDNLWPDLQGWHDVWNAKLFQNEHNFFRYLFGRIRRGFVQINRFANIVFFQVFERVDVGGFSIVEWLDFKLVKNIVSSGVENRHLLLKRAD
jgi:hypothetical protein